MTARLDVDVDYLQSMLSALLDIPSPSGYTGQVVHYVGRQLEELGVPFELTRRGAIRGDLKGKISTPDRAMVAHLDTIGAMVTRLKPNGRLAILPVGTWPARSAEGARVTVLTGEDSSRGTILPLKASGHAYGDEVDRQRAGWTNLEVRVDELCRDDRDLAAHGFAVGDYVALEPATEVLPNGFVVSRGLDDKAGVAVLLSVARAVVEGKTELPIDCHLLFTISEEVGSGASAVLHQDVAEMVSVDNATTAPDQNSPELDVTICMMDSTGPFDYYLTQELIRLCEVNEIPHRRDVFRNYRCDAASAVEAGNDLRTALACFGLDASHGQERTHLRSLEALARLLLAYVRSEPTVPHDRFALGPLDGFPQPPA